MNKTLKSMAVFMAFAPALVFGGDKSSELKALYKILAKSCNHVVEVGELKITPQCMAQEVLKMCEAFFATASPEKALTVGEKLLDVISSCSTANVGKKSQRIGLLNSDSNGLIDDNLERYFTENISKKRRASRSLPPVE